MFQQFKLSLVRFSLVSSAVLLAACSGGDGESQEKTLQQDDNAIIADTEFVFISRNSEKTVDATADKLQKSLSSDNTTPLDVVAPYEFEPGAKLMLRSSLDIEGQSVDILAAYFGSPDYDVKNLNTSYDGKTLLFAAHGPLDHPTDNTWNIYEYRFETGEVRRLIADDVIANAGQDTNPAYTKTQTVVFSTDRAAGNSDHPSDVTLPEDTEENCYKISPSEKPSLLHAMTLQGENIIQLTYGNHHDTQPASLKDGRVAFMRWSRSYELVPQCDLVLANTRSQTAAVNLFSSDYPAGIEAPANWSNSELCAYTQDTPFGPALASNHYSILRIAADGSELQRLYNTVDTGASDEAMLNLQELVQAENGQLITLLKHRYNGFLGGNVMELQSPNDVASGVVFANMSLEPVIADSVGLFPNQASLPGWYSAVAPYRDGSSRLLVSWAQCTEVDAGVSAFCRADSDANSIESAYGIWVYNPQTDSRLPVVKAKAGTEYTELALAQPHVGLDYPFAPYSEDYIEDVDGSRIVCDDPGVQPTPEPSIVPSYPPSPTPTPAPSIQPSVMPSVVPSIVPTIAPTVVPSVMPSVAPSITPTVTPSVVPSVMPSVTPSIVPSVTPSVTPTVAPTPTPSVTPSIAPPTPTPEPSSEPTPTVEPTPVPTSEPSVPPSAEPSIEPSAEPSVEPSVEPSAEPSVEPSVEPSTEPSAEPSAEPTPTPTPSPTPVNHAPTANAGLDQALETGVVAQLNGSGSTDLDGDPLTYSWYFVELPVTSSVTLADETSVTPQFTPDVAGAYIVALVVSDGTSESGVDTVSINVSLANTAPVADAGDDLSTSVGSSVSLDGSGSFDADGDALTYSWSLVSAPAESQVQLSDVSVMQPHVLVDTSGDYTFALVVSDGLAESSADTVVLSTSNAKPVADAGDDRTVDQEGMLTVDGSGSYDPEMQPLAFSWSLISTPDGSAAKLIAPESVATGIAVDLPGDYVVQLVVNDGEWNSEPDTVLITVNEPPACDMSGVDSRSFPVVIRDFKSSHPDFEYKIASDRGIVTEWLGEDGKPVYAHGRRGTETTNGPDAFASWYNDVEDVNLRLPMSLEIQRTPGTDIWTYENSAFFPIDDSGWGPTPGFEHNYHFTLESHLYFDYLGGEKFVFRGDDDLWLYINGRRAIDIGGVHGVQEKSIALDDVADQLGIEIGGRYSFDLFFAERHTVESNFMFQTSIVLSCEEPEAHP
ncbi:PKD domain-containing protein [Teredinibacter turnerae]|uniref:PKD domain-containing protein n=1 Tax=Teredinibacter turnerae TaxID=2426 RepID=UPI00038051BD|nr:fibro-slime domain-containing protein [Teredinibacter turnerae]